MSDVRSVGPGWPCVSELRCGVLQGRTSANDLQQAWNIREDGVCWLHTTYQGGWSVLITHNLSVGKMCPPQRPEWDAVTPMSLLPPRREAEDMCSVCRQRDCSGIITLPHHEWGAVKLRGGGGLRGARGKTQGMLPHPTLFMKLTPPTHDSVLWGQNTGG